MNTNLVQNQATTPPVNAPSWVLILGASLAVITFLYLLYLGLSKNKPDKNARGFIAVAVAIALALAFGLIGGYAKAEGQIPISDTISPIQFGVGGGIGVFVIVYALLWYTLVRESGPSKVNDDTICITFSPNTTLRDGIEAAAKAAGKTVIYLPENAKFDNLVLKEGEVMAKPVEKFIELLAFRLVEGGSINYRVEDKPGTNAIQIKT